MKKESILSRLRSILEEQGVKARPIDIERAAEELSTRKPTISAEALLKEIAALKEALGSQEKDRKTLEREIHQVHKEILQYSTSLEDDKLIIKKAKELKQ